MLFFLGVQWVELDLGGPWLDASNELPPQVLQDSLHGALLPFQLLGPHILGLLLMYLEQPLDDFATTSPLLVQAHPHVLISTEVLVEVEGELSLPAVVVEVECLGGVCIPAVQGASTALLAENHEIQLSTELLGEHVLYVEFDPQRNVEESILLEMLISRIQDQLLWK